MAGDPLRAQVHSGTVKSCPTRRAWSKEFAPWKQLCSACSSKPSASSSECWPVPTRTHPIPTYKLPDGVRAVPHRGRPWLLQLNSELQFRNGAHEAAALSDALIAVAYTWAAAKQRAFDTAAHHRRRRQRALNISWHLRDAFGVSRLEVWGLAINVSFGPRTPVPSSYMSSRGLERSDFPGGMPALPYWGYYVSRSWESWARVQ